MRLLRASKMSSKSRACGDERSRRGPYEPPEVRPIELAQKSNDTDRNGGKRSERDSREDERQEANGDLERRTKANALPLRQEGDEA